jgi:hypothetical protein
MGYASFLIGATAQPMLHKGMRDLRDLLSGSRHIERIVFACDQTHVVHKPAFREEKRTHYYIGASSHDRFLLLEIPSPEAANQTVDLLKLASPAAVARTSDTHFYYNGPMITPRPRSASDSNLENAFRMRLYPLRELLQLGLMVAKPGSIRWDGDRFTAKYLDEMKKQSGNFCVSFGKPGEDVPESVKEKFLANLQNPPQNQTSKTTGGTGVRRMAGLDGKIIWSSDGNLEPVVIPKPTPGSIEARIVAHHVAKHEARMAKGIHGQLLRDAQGNVSEIRCEEGSYRIELDYAPSADLPLPWPHRIRRFINSSRSESDVPSNLMTIYSVRISDQPLEDETFVPWSYLKAGTYVRGIGLPNGCSKLADPKDHKLHHDLMRIKDSQRGH